MNEKLKRTGKEAGPSDKQTAQGSDFTKHFRKEKRVEQEMEAILARCRAGRSPAH